MKTHHFYRISDGQFTGASFRGPVGWLAANTPDGCGSIPLDDSPDPSTQRVSEAGDLEQWERPVDLAALAAEMRAERARRLAACDWTQLADVPAATSQAWEGYRQALREITGQAGFPTNINWPQEPA